MTRNKIIINALIMLTLSSGSLYAACPNQQGTYQSSINNVKIHLQKQDDTHYQAVLDVPGYPLTVRAAQFASEDERKSHPYYKLPDCTLNIEKLGQLLPHSKGSLFYVHFDSRDFQKKFDTDYVLKIDETPDGLLGMNKVSDTLSTDALDALKKK